MPELPRKENAGAGEAKKFFCGTAEVCPFKQHYVNNRCFAVYSVRQSCPKILRRDGKTILEGSKEEAVLTK